MLLDDPKLTQDQQNTDEEEGTKGGEATSEESTEVEDVEIEDSADDMGLEETDYDE